jgi:filamentous hemagglutinin family protein
MRLSFLRHRRMPALSISLLLRALATLVLWLSSLPIAGQAYAQTPITPSGLNTQVSQPVTLPSGQTQYNITGGTRPNGGANLFHSFGEFGVLTNDIANFFNDSGLATSNILGRVTGGNPSSILGTIQTTGFDNANLFLMNPSGIVFGPNATLNVGGSVTFTTANYLKLAELDGTAGVFHADLTASSVLTSAPVAAFGFLGSNSAAISVEGSTLTVDPGQSISLVGGNQGFNYPNPDTGEAVFVASGVTMTGGTLSAPAGQINLVSVASPGEVLYPSFNNGPNINGAQFTNLGNLSLTDGAFIDVSADSAGTVKIRGGQFVMDNASISADTIDADGAPIAMDINIDGDMSLSNELSPALTARTTGSGNAGEINIQSGNLDAVTSSSDILVALIDTHTSGTGTAGSVAITTGNLHATNEGFFIDTGSAGIGHGGNVNIQGTNIFIEGPNIGTGNFRFAQLLGQDVSGSGGNLSMKAAESLEITGSSVSTEAWFAEAGSITLDARDILINGNSQIALDGDFGGATIRVNADRLRLDFSSRLTNNTVVDPGGDTTINARVVELTRGSFIQTSTLGDGTAGNIILTATERLTIDDRANPTHLVSGLISTVQEDSFGTFGGTGSIMVTTPQLEMFGGGIINTTTRNSGNSGDVSIFANSVTISGQRAFEFPGSILELGTTRGSGIYTRTVGSDLCVGPCGNAGNMTIMTDSLNLDSGGTINSGTTNDGAGGNITVNATQSITISGATTDGTPSGIYSRTVGQMVDAGAGGNITLAAGQSVTMSDGAAVSASSTGPANAGDIAINAGQQLEMRDSSITTEAIAEGTQASGGNIDIQAVELVHLVNSTISASVQGDATTSGGNITIDPNSVILQNSQILAQAIQGAAATSRSSLPCSWLTRPV